MAETPKKLARHIILSAVEDIPYLTVSEMVVDAIDDIEMSIPEIDDLVDQVAELISEATVKVKWDD